MDHEFVMKNKRIRPNVREKFELNDDLQIGRGSYGVVYKVHRRNDTRPNKQYFALKVIDLLPYSPSACREISVYREINHRNIMALLQIFFSHSTRKACLLFDYAEYDLHSIIRYYRANKTTMPIQMVKSSLYQILLGVEYLHNNWILHRDLKPENILVMGDGPERGCIKITDLGMARTFHSPLRPLTDIDSVVVTCWYRAPELFLGTRHYTKAIDVFSIGCIFAELLTNVPIFHCLYDKNEQNSRSPYQFNQMHKMFSVLGFPTTKDWEDLKVMPEFDKLTREFSRNKYRSCNLVRYMKIYNITPSQQSFKLLKRFLTMDPTQRINCPEALTHAYILEHPNPTDNAFTNIARLPFPKRPYLINNDVSQTAK